VNARLDDSELFVRAVRSSACQPGSLSGGLVRLRLSIIIMGLLFLSTQPDSDAGVPVLKKMIFCIHKMEVEKPFSCIIGQSTSHVMKNETKSMIGITKLICGFPT
jgi:hypothetical protein